MDTMNAAVTVAQVDEVTYGPRPKGTTRNRKPTTKPKRIKRNTPAKYIEVNDMGRTVGVEVTFIPGGFERDDNVDMSGLAMRLAPAFKSRVAKALGRDSLLRTGGVKSKHPTHAGLYKGVTCDPECIEAPTAPTDKRNKLFRTMESLYTVAASLNMVTYTDWHGGGGAHIHVGTKRTDPKNMDMYMALVATAHPYLTWAFMNPGDFNRNAMPHCALVSKSQNTLEALKYAADDWRNEYMFSAASHRAKTPYKTAARTDQYVRDSCAYARSRFIANFKAYLKARRVTTTDAVATAWNVSKGSFNKGAAISKRDMGTYEFRLFRAPDDIHGHTRQINFALAYTEYCERLAREGKQVKLYMASIEQAHKDYPYTRAVEGFKAFLRELGLNTRHYRADIENMKRYYQLNELDISATYTPEAHGPKPVCITLPRSQFTRKHKQGMAPASVSGYVRPSRGQRRKAARLAKIAALQAAQEAQRVAAEAKAAQEAAMAEALARGYILRQNLMDNVKVGDTLVIRMGRNGGTNTRTETVRWVTEDTRRDTQMQTDTFRYGTYMIETVQGESYSGFGTYYTDSNDSSAVIRLNDTPVLWGIDVAEYIAAQDAATQTE